MPKRILAAVAAALGIMLILLSVAYMLGKNAARGEVLDSPAVTETSTEIVEIPSVPVSKIADDRSLEALRATLLIEEDAYEGSFALGESAYDLMEKLRSGGLAFVSTYHEGLGYFIESIGNISNSPREGRYWTLYVNGKRSSLGASNVILREGDIIGWKLEKN